MVHGHMDRRRLSTLVMSVLRRRREHKPEASGNRQVRLGGARREKNIRKRASPRGARDPLRFRKVRRTANRWVSTDDLEKLLNVQVAGVLACFRTGLAFRPDGF